MTVTSACSSGGDADRAPVGSTPAPSPACGFAAATAVERVDVEVDGVSRFALVHVPAGAAVDAPLPVVLSFHGGGMDAAAQQSIDGLVQLADTESFVVVHPQGLTVDIDADVRGVTGWDVQGHAVDEPAFVAALLDELGARVCIDTARVAATGSSNGGAMAMLLACELPGRVAAVAPVAAAFVPTDCADPHTMPVDAFHGEDDLVAPIGGSAAPAQVLRPVRDVIAEQAERNGCDATPRVDQAFGITTTTWTGCDAPTQLMTLPDHGHAWPGHRLPVTQDVLSDSIAADPVMADSVMTNKGLTPRSMAANMLLTNETIDATALMWQFFVEAWQ